MISNEDAPFTITPANAGLIYPFDFVAQDDELEVYLWYPASSPPEGWRLVDPAGYTVSYDGPQPSAGDITLGTLNIAVTHVMVIRKSSRNQDRSWLRYDSFPAARTEEAMDKLTLIVQEQDSLLDNDPFADPN